MRKVLIADDRQENRYVLKNFFKLFGTSAEFDIVEASSAEEVMNQLKEIQPDLILMDIKMETETAGLDAVKQIRKTEPYKDLQIWAITAQAMEAHDLEDSDKDKCLKAGCNDYISKPFDPVDLLMKVANFFSVEIPDNVKKKIGIS
ncbi:MAG: response regulator [Spirochaetes bacterium]|nr:response regulator [Spirochaetota bacterium]